MSFKESMMVIGENMRAIREKKGLSRKEVQDITNISQQYIGEIERGEGNPTIEILFKLSAAYEVSIAELIGDPMVYSTRLNSLIKKMKFVERQDVYRLLTTFDKLSKDDIEALVFMIEQFKK